MSFSLRIASWANESSCCMFPNDFLNSDSLILSTATGLILLRSAPSALASTILDSFLEEIASVWTCVSLHDKSFWCWSKNCTENATTTQAKHNKVWMTWSRVHSLNLHTLLTKQDSWRMVKSFFSIFMDQDEVKVH